MLPAAILTDLDGTLLEAGGSLSSAARRAVDALTSAGVPTIPLTSKTAPELSAFLAVLAAGGIGAYENGAGVLTPWGDRALPWALSLPRLRGALARLRSVTGLALVAIDELALDEL